jgi:hypothetical protein
MSDALTSLPVSFAAGTTVAYRKTFTDYPAGEWTFTLYLAGASILAIEAVADGDDFVTTIIPADTEVGFAPGHYKWAERVSKGTEVYEIASGTVTILPNLAQASEGSEQEWLETAIAALTAHIQGRLPTGMESYQIAGRAVSRIPLKEAVGLLSSLESRLLRLKNPTAAVRPMLVSFTPTGFTQ